MQGANHESVSGRVLVDVVSCSPVRVPLRTALQGVSGKYLAGDLDIHLTPFYACKWLKKSCLAVGRGNLTIRRILPLT